MSVLIDMSFVASQIATAREDVAKGQITMDEILTNLATEIWIQAHRTTNGVTDTWNRWHSLTTLSYIASGLREGTA